MQHRLVIASVGLVLGVSATAHGQRATAQAGTDDSRWYPWIGCWQRSGDTGASGQFTCVRPGSDGSADILTISNGAVETREHLVADGAPHPIETGGCRGSQTASWSTTDGGSRLYIGAAYTCSGGLRGRSTRMFAIVPSGVWLEVLDVHAGGGWVETVTRFHDAGLPASIPAAVRSEISRRGLVVATARAAASAPVSAVDIAEATRAVDTLVVQSWLAARNEALGVDSTAARNAMASNSATSSVRIFYGQPPSQPQPVPVEPDYYAPTEPGCDPYGCNPYRYSSYNGYPPLVNGYPYPYPYSTYLQPGVLGFGLGGFGFGGFTPFGSTVVVNNGSRRQGHGNKGDGHPVGGRPWGARPGGVNPGGMNPGGAQPGGPRPGGARPGGANPPLLQMPGGTRAAGRSSFAQGTVNRAPVSSASRGGMGGMVSRGGRR